MVEEKSTSNAKSIRKKAAVKIISKPKSSSEIQQTAETVKPQGFNLDLTNFSSAAVTLVGTAILFMIGWAYEANWYSYFGVDISQLNIAPQQYLVRSANALMTSLVLVFLSYIFLLLARIILIVQREYNSNILTLFPSLKDWPVVTFIYLFISTAIMFPQLTSSLDVMPAELRYFSLNIKYVLGLMGVLFLLYVFAHWLAKFLGASKIIPQQIQDGFRSQDIMYKEVSKQTRIKALNLIHSPNAVIFPVYLFLLTTLAIAASQAVSNASRGAKLAASYIPKVFLISPKRLPSLQTLNESCNEEDTCQYGPFGLIAENDQAFFMVEWKENNIPFHPGLFIFPRDDKDGAYLIIPGLSTISTVTAQPTSTATPTPPTTATLSAKSINTLTPIPTICQP